MSDTALLNIGVKTLIDTLGVVGAERFVYLVNKEHGDYTEFRHTLFTGMTFDAFCREAAQTKMEVDERNNKA